MAANSFSTEVSPKPFALGELRRLGAPVARCEREDVGRRLDQAVVVEELDLLVAEPLDVEGVARDEMLQPLPACAGQMRPPVQRRTTSASPVFASISRTAWRPQAGQMCGKLVRLRALRALVEHDADDLRDDVAGALHDHGVADADVLARDLVLVVQRRVRHDDAADGHRLELGDRRQRAGAADLDVDVAQDRSSPARRGTCARSPSAARARRSRAAPAESSRSTL